MKEHEKDWGDPADAFDMSNTSAPQEDSHLASNIAAAAVELATDGTQIAPSSGGILLFLLIGELSQRI